MDLVTKEIINTVESMVLVPSFSLPKSTTKGSGSMAGKAEKVPFTTKTGRSFKEGFGKMESILKRVPDLLKLYC
jgi:hypothetical protein